MPSFDLSPQRILPTAPGATLLIGRIWLPGKVAGPSLVYVDAESVYDLSKVAPTCSELMNMSNPVAEVRNALRAEEAPRLAATADVLANSDQSKRDPKKPYFLSPPDLQALKACGVTFVSSMLERVIEEQAKGDPNLAETIRKSIGQEIGTSLSNVKPGSEQAAKVKESLVKRGLWSQYLEVGIGPDAEVFTKSQPMSAVGVGSDVGIHPRSQWNNPEPEMVMCVNARGEIVGASVGNDVNLRDFEGRSALLLGRGKDNNASCAIGPFIRLFDANFTLEDVRRATIEVEVRGEDGYEINASYGLANISRDITDLVGQTINRNHQYPDGLMLFLGTMFAPTQDRGQPGQGFTHKIGDNVTIRCAHVGTLVNRVKRTDEVAAWTFGTGQLLKNLAARKLL
jgi:fumarylacetoacetate (FAA) hydrolase family protein